MTKSILLTYIPSLWEYTILLTYYIYIFIFIFILIYLHHVAMTPLLALVRSHISPSNPADIRSPGHSTVPGVSPDSIAHRDSR